MVISAAHKKRDLIRMLMQVRESDHVRKSVGKALREYRVLAGISQLDLASRMGASAQRVCDVECGVRKPSKRFIDSLLGFMRSL
jgi:predicted transcriptional regulator